MLLEKKLYSLIFSYIKNINDSLENINEMEYKIDEKDKFDFKCFDIHNTLKSKKDYCTKKIFLGKR